MIKNDKNHTWTNSTCTDRYTGSVDNNPAFEFFSGKPLDEDFSGKPLDEGFDRSVGIKKNVSNLPVKGEE